MAIEIVDFPIKHGDFPVCYVKLPEGTSSQRFFVHTQESNPCGDGG